MVRASRANSWALGRWRSKPEVVKAGVVCTRYSVPSANDVSDPALPAGQSPLRVSEKSGVCRRHHCTRRK